MTKQSIKSRPASSVQRRITRRPAAATSKSGGASSGTVGFRHLWAAKPCVLEGWHRRNVTFWKAQSPDVRGATGGGVSERDLSFSKEIVAMIVARFGRRFKRALDCGAGIGRVTDKVLRQYCEHVDLVEFVKKHLVTARKHLPAAGKSGCTFSFHNSSMQKFDIGTKRYDLVWCSWLLMYLTDVDVVDLLARARKGLVPGGLILVKENIATADKSEEQSYFDDAEGELWTQDSATGPVSCVRTDPHYRDLFQRAGLVVGGAYPQTDLGDDCMDMTLYILFPAKK